jgi:hypothetical protein
MGLAQQLQADHSGQWEWRFGAQPKVIVEQLLRGKTSQSLVDDGTQLLRIS